MLFNFSAAFAAYASISSEIATSTFAPVTCFKIAAATALCSDGLIGQREIRVAPS